ncbi:NUDIX domain-containing protein [Streptomyces sp. NPDC014894]|uniref:NUDIX domain-containing protein n=1 Tax=Streptomyces sp. NPDC014894 TaxID=3364931 RepID=UPI0036F62534
MLPVGDQRGNTLTRLVHRPETDPPADAPTPFALVALRLGGRTLMAYHRGRDAWELPGGMIDPGESAREAAVRELFEETAQRPDGRLDFVGYAAFVLGPGRRAEYGALFTGRAERPRDFRPNDEMSAIAWWDPRLPLPGRVQPIDAYLAVHAAAARGGRGAREGQ